MISDLPKLQLVDLCRKQVSVIGVSGNTLKGINKVMLLIDSSVEPSLKVSKKLKNGGFDFKRFCNFNGSHIEILILGVVAVS